MVGQRHSHYISLLRPEDLVPDMGNCHLQLRFHDVESETPGHIAPTREDIRQVIEFARALPEDADLLIHCMAGISRSTAIGVGVACVRGRTPADALKLIIDSRQPTLEPGYVVMPNRWMIQFFDEELGLAGELSRVVDEYYDTLPLLGVTRLPNRGGWNTSS